MKEEPLPMMDFLVTGARTIAAASREQNDEIELKRLLADASRIGS